MYKIGLKLWSTNKQYVHEAQRLFDQGFCNYIELFAVPDSFDEHIKLWAGLKIPYIIHAPHSAVGLNLANKDAREQNKVLINETLKYADALSASTIIFHSGGNGNIDETIYQLKEINDSRITIENKPYLGSPVRGVSGLCNGYSSEEIKKIIEQVGTMFCLDMGHAIYAANALNVDSMEYLKQFMLLSPQMFHLADGDWMGKYDHHKHLGKGDFPLKDILVLLPSDAVISLETPHAFADRLDDFDDDVRYLRNILLEVHKKTMFFDSQKVEGV